MLLFTLLATFLPATFAVKCYVCSWSPKDAPNRTVICNDDLFEANAVYILECSSGCETYTHWDSNGSLEQLRRNCLQPETELTNDCKEEETIAYKSKRCTCNSDLCNSAPLLSSSFFVPALILATSFIVKHLPGI
jgi:hypothetical protein